MSHSNQTQHSKLAVMNFLNEISIDYPHAISFASGRPTEDFFHLKDWVNQIDVFNDYLASKMQLSDEQINNYLAQYGRTNGVINDLIAQQSVNDEGLICTAQQVIVTAGCQEAMVLCLNALCNDANDVLLVCNPTYIGITGLAEISRVNYDFVSCNENENFVSNLANKVTQLKQAGKNIKALYVVADFDNPTGNVMAEAMRKQLVDYCAEQRIAILEDNPYGLFRYEGQPQSKLASLDDHGCVIYLGTYSKSLCPSVRIGFIITPPQLFGNEQAAIELTDKLSQIKSFITVNTSQITQAVVGGVLLEQNLSLKNLIAPAINKYRHNRDVMVSALEVAFGNNDNISWNCPQGGFFLTVNLPFVFDGEQAQICASQYDLLAMPMSFFALDGQYDYQVRFSFSNVDPEKIKQGVARFAQYVKDKLG